MSEGNDPRRVEYRAHVFPDFGESTSREFGNLRDRSADTKAFPKYGRAVPPFEPSNLLIQRIVSLLECACSGDYP